MEETGQFPWVAALSNFIWIIGASIILATMSWQEFQVRQRKIKWRDALRSREFLRPFYLGAFLVMVGIVASINSAWIAALGSVTAFFFLFLLIRVCKG